jgi:hypothetical protein
MELLVVGVCDRWTLVRLTFQRKRATCQKKKKKNKNTQTHTHLKKKHVTKERGNNCGKTRNNECNGRGVRRCRAWS